MSQLVAYYRVSTKKQQASGLGLEAQKEAVRSYALSSQCVVVHEYQEIESGKNHENRPQLQLALEHCELTGSKLVIAKLDRLSRNVAFLANLMESGVKFIACDNPQANELTIHILAAVAQEERRAISARTIAALAAAKSRGVRLGNPKLSEARNARVKGRELEAANHTRHTLAVQRASKIIRVVEKARKDGCRTLQSIADYLNKSTNIRTSRGCEWTRNAVKRVLVMAVN